MAIVFEANYSKKLGLPGFSSHQYSVTVRSELSDLSQIDSESKRLYALLQSSVDRELQQTGFLPEDKQNGHANSNGKTHANGSESWACSAKQRDLIVKIVEENKLDKAKVEATAQSMFGKSVKALNKLEASGLIEEGDTFRFVLIDEALSRIGDEFSAYLFEVFSRFHLQLLIIHPRDAKLHITERFVRRYNVALKPERFSSVVNMTVHEFHEYKKRFSTA